MKEIIIYAGERIEDAYKDMQRYKNENNEKCYCKFNGMVLFSDNSLDECYKKVTGNTKEEFHKKIEEENERIIEKENEFKKKIPTLIEEYRNKARGIISEELLQKWDKIVPIRLNDLYHGMELDCWLDIIKVLNKDIDEEERFVECKRLFEEQGHSGFSASLVMGGLVVFHKDGKKLVEYLKDYE